MTPEEWLGFIPSIARQVRDGSRYLVLRAGQGAEDIGAAEQALQRSLPTHLKQAILDHEGQSAWSLLETLASLLTPGEDPLRLTPTGKLTAHLFPTLAHVLESITEWAVFFDVDTPERSLLGGTRPALRPPTQQPPSARDTSWACYLPVGSEALRDEERQADVQFSPQMQQFYLLTGGGLDDVTWPYVSWVGTLMRGELYESIYGLEEVQEQLHLPEELLHLLQDYVELLVTVVGDSYGFFANEPHQRDEYHIYEWLTHKQQFVPVAEDFSAFVERVLMRRW